MKKSVIIWYVFLLSVFNAYSQWIPCGPKDLVPYKFTTMIAYRDTIYGNDNGIVTYSTTPYESYWEMADDTLPNIGSILYINGDKIYSRVSKKIMTTSDKGKNWSDPFPEFQNNNNINVLSFKGDIILALANDGEHEEGLYLSQDNGKNWELLYNDFYLMYANFIAASPQADTILMNINTAAYSSTDKGKTWKKSKIAETASDKEFKYPIFYKGDLIVWSSENPMMRSSDGGETWNPDYTITQVKFMYLIDTFMVVMTHNDGLRFYTKQDDKYVLVRSPLKGVSVMDVCQVGNTLTANTYQGYFFSSDLGETWTAKNEGINPGISNMTMIDTTVYISTGSIKGDPLKTTDNGVTWEKLPLDTLAPAFSEFSTLTILDSLFIYSQFYHNYLFVSTNGGKSWRNNFQDQSLQSLRAYSVYLNKDGSVLARAKDGIYVSYDTIRTWTKVDSTSQSYSFKTIVQSGKSLFACSDEGVLRSSDVGRTWAKVDHEFINPKIRGIESNRKYLIAFSFDSVLYFSTDYGSNWRTIKTPFGSLWSAASAGDNIFAVSYGKGLYLTRDFGENWELISGDISRFYLNNVVISKDSILVSAQMTSVYKAALSDFGVYVSASDGPGFKGSDFLRLYNPYPIPADYELRVAIQWDITRDIDKDDISIYNLFGKVAGRENIRIEKESAYSGMLHWDCSRYEPGVYFIVVSHGDATRMIKAIVER